KNYVEILGLVNPQHDQAGFGWSGFLDRFAGAHIICFGCEKVDTVVERLKSNQINNSGAVVLQRDVETPDGIKTAIFDRVLIDAQHTPEARRVQAAHHRFPEYVHQERYMQHKNGAQSLSALYITSDNPTEAAQ